MSAQHISIVPADSWMRNVTRCCNSVSETENKRDGNVQDSGLKWCTSAFQSPSLSHHHPHSILSPRNVTARASYAQSPTTNLRARRNTGDHQHDGHLARIGRSRQLIELCCTTIAALLWEKNSESLGPSFLLLHTWHCTYSRSATWSSGIRE